MLEAECNVCGEIFIPHSETREDLIHGIREDGEECGGEGTVLGEWIPPRNPHNAFYV